ncbi:MAG TPA: universal stress protein [Thermoanaerobaculia bacterium]|nr:universal stress protein [Thermoanaerobaculia bacterium]
MTRGRIEILVGVDFSRQSLGALRAARALAVRCGGRVTIAHVRPTSNVRAAVIEERGDLLRGNPERLSAAMAEHYARRLGGLRFAKGEKTLLLRGVAGRALCREARRRYDLLALGDRGRGRVASFLLGSTVQVVLARSTIPVLVVRRSALTRNLRLRRTGERLGRMWPRSLA